MLRTSAAVAALFALLLADATRRAHRGIAWACIACSLALSLVATFGCAGPLDAAKRTTNAARDLAPVLAAVIDEACTKEYAKALQAGPIVGLARQAELDKVCLPLGASYRALRAAHLAAVAAILSAEAGRLDVPRAVEAAGAVLKAVEAAQAAAAAAGGAK